MASVEEYVRMAEEAQKDGAHVAVFTYYRTAIEGVGYNTSAVAVLLAAIQYTQKLKKERDRIAIAQWGQEVVQRITPKTDLVGTISTEIAKLQAIGDKHATT
ncbi:hypothetical protein HYX00_02275 [Candidatus Woesearchaeota archaeon]|nr:hypothetical protein [Candidatus Woesearchaeota archaeon]